jgi:hypothetical protein
MKVIMTMGMALLFSVSGWAQTTSTTAMYREGNTIVDGSGNLAVLDLGRSTTGVTITGQRHSFFAPKTRITVQHPGPATTGNPQTVEYDGVLQVIGSGTAVYAIATVYTVSGTAVTTSQSLIAIDLSKQLPAALSGFPALALTSQVDARVGPNDYISLVTDPDSAKRTATVVHFVGGAFAPVSSGPLP